MKQLSQNMRSGELAIEEVPEPALLPGGALVRNACSLISAGTERQKLEMGRKSLLGKARARPDLVKKVVKKLKTEGIGRTVQTVKARLDAPSPLGYSCAGYVQDVAESVPGLRPGDAVACGGALYAVHAEAIWAPGNLIVPVPTGVTMRQASLATVGAIAMQGVRQAEPTLGETIVVIGLGLIGQLTCLLLRTAGCRVIGVDTNPRMVEIARRSGAEFALAAQGDEVAHAVGELTGGHGADATLICASTPSSQPVALAGEITRDRGRVVVVGLVGMEIPREPFYMKEIDLRLSRSYGPGRYDPEYEEKGHDYPFGYVRWTERRNMACFLDLIAQGRIDIDHILTHDFPFDRAIEAYDLLSNRDETYLGITLTYPHPEKTPPPKSRPAPSPAHAIASPGPIGVALVGAGNYAQANLLPVLRDMNDASLVAVADAQGLVAGSARSKFGFQEIAEDFDAVLANPKVEWVVIATRHDTHAELARRALEAGKHVHVEKPLGLSIEELDAVTQTHAEARRHLTVGFNRRFAPATVGAMEYLARCAAPRTILIRVNAGALEPGHWLLDPEVGGGRIVGEGCHFVDLACLLADAPPKRVFTIATQSQHAPKSPREHQDVTIAMEFANGSVASVVYCSQGDPSLPKERIEVMAGGRHVLIDDFRQLHLSSGGRSSKQTCRPQDKGQKAMLAAEARAMRTGSESPISIDALRHTTLATFAAIESIRTGEPVDPASLETANRETE